MDSNTFLSVSERFVAETAVRIGSQAINKNPVQNLNLSLKGALYASKTGLSLFQIKHSLYLEI